MAKIDTPFKTKTAEKQTLWGRTYPYSPYNGVPLPTGGLPVDGSLQFSTQTELTISKEKEEPLPSEF